MIRVVVVGEAEARRDVVGTDIRMPPTMTDERSGPFRARTQVPGRTGLASCRREDLVGVG